MQNVSFISSYFVWKYFFCIPYRTPLPNDPKFTYLPIILSSVAQKNCTENCCSCILYSWWQYFQYDPQPSLAAAWWSWIFFTNVLKRTIIYHILYYSLSYIYIFSKGQSSNKFFIHSYILYIFSIRPLSESISVMVLNHLSWRPFQKDRVMHLKAIF